MVFPAFGGVGMMAVTNDSGAWAEVLLAGLGEPSPPPVWGELDGLLAPRRVLLRPTCSLPDTFARIEAGGLDLAVLWAHDTCDSGLTALERIRGLSDDLPCLLVAPHPSPAMLRRALLLRAASVIALPVGAAMLAGWLLRLLNRRPIEC